MQISEPITTTCRCGATYTWATIFELADYVDAFPENSATPCCDDNGYFLESDIIEYVMENLDRFLFDAD